MNLSRHHTVNASKVYEKLFLQASLGPGSTGVHNQAGIAGIASEWSRDFPSLVRIPAIVNTDSCIGGHDGPEYAIGLKSEKSKV